jgi:peptidylprolyl isomerase/FK506-binding protein 1
MSWEKTILSQGNGVDMPAIGASVKIDYTGWLRDPQSADHEKGTQYARIFKKCASQKEKTD